MASIPSVDLALWRSFRRAFAAISTAIERDLAAETQLSATDYGVIARLAESGRHRVRQQELAVAMGWDRTRLSHHLTRMEQRGLIARFKGEQAGTYVSLTTAGEAAHDAARPVYERAIAAHFAQPLSPAEREAITTWSQRAATGGADGTP